MEMEIHIELVTRRRVLLMTYRRYLEADRAWDISLRNLNAWVPDENLKGTLAIGSPGSPVRRLYVRRQRALVQLEAVRLKLQVAKQRIAAKQSETGLIKILLS